jgi:hypothetical protein
MAANGGGREHVGRVYTAFEFWSLTTAAFARMAIGLGCIRVISRV